MIGRIHEGHAGIVKCKKRGRKVMYWPGMSCDIEKYVLECEACEKYRQSNVKEPLMSHEIFFKVGMDICHYGTKDFLVLIDYYSKCIEVKLLENKTAVEIIKKCKQIFSTHGIPKYIMSDNMPFNSLLFKKFANDFIN